jgi:hypothetical protein
MLKSSDTKMLEDIQRLFMNTGRPQLDAWRRHVAEHPYRSSSVRALPNQVPRTRAFQEAASPDTSPRMPRLEKGSGDKILYRIRTYYQRFSRHGL